VCVHVVCVVYVHSMYVYVFLHMWSIHMCFFAVISFGNISQLTHMGGHERITVHSPQQLAEPLTNLY